MNPIKLVAIVLIVAGVLGLAYGSFSYTKDTTVVKLGPLEVSAKQKETVNVPIWAGEALDLIDDLELAAPLVQKIAHDAERALTRAHAYIR